ncbi:MAG: hypothetical protein WC119_00150 [Synergistaceae bacterium]
MKSRITLIIAFLIISTLVYIGVQFGIDVGSVPVQNEIALSQVESNNNTGDWIATNTANRASEMIGDVGTYIYYAILLIGGYKLVKIGVEVKNKKEKENKNA